MAPSAIRRKLVIIGDGACGKTSLLSVFAMGEFPKDYEPTIFENYVAEIRLDGKAVQLALWDTAGQEEYERLRPLSYSKSHVILIAFSIDTPDSLENVTTKWIEEVRTICGEGIPVILVGCKGDLRKEGGGEGVVSRKQGEQVATQIGARTYKECSSLRNEGVDDVFEAATRAAMLVRTQGVATTTSGGGGGGGHGGGDGHGHSNGKSRRSSSGYHHTHGNSGGSGGGSYGGRGGEKGRTGGGNGGGGGEEKRFGCCVIV